MCASNAGIRVQTGAALLAGDELALPASPIQRIYDEGLAFLLCLVLPALDILHRGSLGFRESTS